MKWKKILVAILVILIIIQIPFFTPKKNYTDKDSTITIADKYDVPMDIQMIIYSSCNDCHSNYTENYPWYYHIQPVSWWMNHHIQTAKRHVNFSEFAAYSPKEAAEKFFDIHKEMENKDMPLKSYLRMHHDAKLTDQQYKQVADWAQKMYEQLKAQIDSADTK